MPPATYSLILRDLRGTKLAHWSDVRSLAYVCQVNAPGSARIVLDGAHPVIPLLADQQQLEIWRRLPGLAWAREWTGLLAARTWEQTSAADATVTVEVDGLLSVLSARIVAYPAATTNQTRFTSTRASTILWRLVQDNLGPGATTANGRLSDGRLRNVTLAADPLAGATLDWSCAWASLLAEAQRLQPRLGGDFDLVPDPANPAQWVFRIYPGQRGEDRRASVVFAVERGTITNVRRREAWRDALSVVIVGGQGEEAARRVRVRTGEPTPLLRERFFDARTAADSDAALDARGDAVLVEARLRDEVAFDVVQTEGCAYGRDYACGDRVTRRAFGTSAEQQITSVAVLWTPTGGEQISVGVSDGPA